MTQKIIKILSIVSCVLVLNACVSVTQSRYSKNTDPEKAAETYVALAVGYMSQGKMILARQKLDRALELNPENPSAHSAFAMYWLERGEIKLAEKEFDTALDLDDEHSPSNFHYGLYLLSQKDKRACPYLAIAAKDVDYSARVLANENLGVCLMNYGEKARAIDAFEKAWVLDSNSTVSSINLSAIYLQRKRLNLAARWFNRFEKTLTDNKVEHTAASLGLGLRLATAGGDRNSEASYAFKLRKRFPKSEEYKNYKRNK